MFKYCTSLQTIPLFDTSSVTNTTEMFSSCLSLTSVPQFNTSSVQNMSYAFSNCQSLTTIPVLDTSNVTNMTSIISSCGNLSNDTLNNLLEMCTNAVKITSATNKTLKKIGLTASQASTCTTLSNYSAFRNAGWTTGY